MPDDYRENKTKIKALSSYDKEEIFWVRHMTLIISSMIVLPILVIFGLNCFLAVLLMACSWFMPCLYFYRKKYWEWLKENIIYWWNMINGRVP